MFLKVFIAALLLEVVAVVFATQIRAQTGSMESEIIALVNKNRAKKDLPPLKQNDAIADAAEKHSRNMAKGKIPMGHDGFDERMGKLLKELAPANGAAENVAMGANSAEEVVALWMKSPGHRKNILGTYTHTGVGIVKGSDGNLYFTQIFINKK